MEVAIGVFGEAAQKTHLLIDHKTKTMKEFIRSFRATKTLFVVAFVLICGTLFAQGGAAGDPQQGLTDYLVGFIPMKYRALITVSLTVLWLLEQYLAKAQWFKANSTTQLLFGWIGSLYRSITGKKS